MKKTGESNTALPRAKNSSKAGSNNRRKTQQPLEPRVGTSGFSEEITIPPRKRISPAADEEME